MRKFALIVILLSVICIPAGAQEAFEKPQFSGYFSIAPGAISAKEFLTVARIIFV